MNEHLWEAIKNNWVVWSIMWAWGYMFGMFIHHGMV